MEKTYYLFQKNKVISSTESKKVSFREHEIYQIVNSNHRNSPIKSGKSVNGMTQEIIELEDDLLLPDGFEPVPLRSLVGKLEDSSFISLSRASQILNWQQTNRFCGSCGSSTKRHFNELAMVCPECDLHFYPRISPCIIVLVSRGEEMLLGRSPRFPGNMFSTLAGFIELSETAEESVSREVWEETRINVKNIRYFASQPWPFPGQLMLGFFAEYESGQIKVDGYEICEADWFHPDDLPRIPIEATISGQLIRSHIANVRK